MQIAEFQKKCLACCFDSEIQRARLLSENKARRQMMQSYYPFADEFSNSSRRFLKVFATIEIFSTNNFHNKFRLELSAKKFSLLRDLIKGFDKLFGNCCFTNLHWF